MGSTPSVSSSFQFIYIIQHPAHVGLGLFLLFPVSSSFARNAYVVDGGVGYYVCHVVLLLFCMACAVNMCRPAGPVLMVPAAQNPTWFGPVLFFCCLTVPNGSESHVVWVDFTSSLPHGSKRLRIPRDLSRFYFFTALRFQTAQIHVETVWFRGRCLLPRASWVSLSRPTPRPPWGGIPFEGHQMVLHSLLRHAPVSPFFRQLW